MEMSRAIIENVQTVKDPDVVKPAKAVLPPASEYFKTEAGHVLIPTLYS